MKTVYTIGRESDCDICLWDETNEVSRHHAQIRIDSKGKYWLMDTSTNGTYVNGLKIVPNQEVLVTRKDEISFAHIEELDWSQIPRKKHIGLICGIAAAVVVVITLIVGAVIYQNNHPRNPDQPLSDSENPANISISTDNKQEKDTAVVKSPADSSSASKPEETRKVKKSTPNKKEQNAKKSNDANAKADAKTNAPAEEPKTPSEESSEVIDAIY